MPTSTGGPLRRPPRGTGAPGARWWRRHPWPGLLAGLAAVALLAIGAVVGYAPGALPDTRGCHGGRITIGDRHRQPGCRGHPGAHSPRRRSELDPPAAPTATPSAGALVFQTLGSVDCEFAGATIPSCETVDVAYFADPDASSQSQDSAVVTFANSAVTIGTNANGASQTTVLESTQTQGLHAVLLGEIWYPAAGTCPHTVAVTGSRDGRTGSWSGGFQVGAQANSTLSASLSAS